MEQKTKSYNISSELSKTFSWDTRILSKLRLDHESSGGSHQTQLSTQGEQVLNPSAHLLPNAFGYKAATSWNKPFTLWIVSVDYAENHTLKFNTVSIHQGSIIYELIKAIHIVTLRFSF